MNDFEAGLLLGILIAVIADMGFDIISFMVRGRA